MSKDKKTKTSIVGWEGLICSLAVIIVSALWINNIYIPSVNGAEKEKYRSYEVSYTDENTSFREFKRIKARVEYDLTDGFVVYFMEDGSLLKVSNGAGIYIHEDGEVIEYFSNCSVLEVR